MLLLLCLKRVTFAQCLNCPEAWYFSLHLLLPYMIKCSQYDASPLFVVGTFLAEIHNKIKVVQTCWLSQEHCEKQGNLLKCLIEQRQISCHPTTAHNWNPLLVSMVLPLHSVREDPVANGSFAGEFCSGVLQLLLPTCLAGCKGLSLQPQHTYALPTLLKSRGQNGPNPLAIEWHTALLLASQVSSMVFSQTRGHGPYRSSGHGNVIFSLPISAARLCYNPNRFQRVQSTIYSQACPPSASRLRYFIYLAKPRREILTSEMWPH